MDLSDKEIVEMIIEYILDRRYNQAILIDGDWGSGKSFFIQNILIPQMINKIGDETAHKRKIIYVSLYGVETFQQIIDEIYTSLFENFFDKRLGEGSGEAIGKGVHFISKIASAGLKYFNIESSELPNMSELKKLKDSVIIFDDLERCNIDVNQIFGFINNLTEHNDIKVIIVGNQSEIGKLSLVRDLPQKYLVVLNNNLLLDTSDENEKKSEEKQPINEEVLKRNAEQLFANDILYEKIKEKLIGITIHYRPSLENKYQVIIETYIDNLKTKEYLFSKNAIIVPIFEKKRHYNLRTMIFAIISFEKLSTVLDQIDFTPAKYIEEQKDKMLEYCVRLSIRLKEGKSPFSWNENSSESGTVYFGDNFFTGENFFGYKFVDDYLQFRSINEDVIKQHVIKIITEKKEQDEYEETRNSLHINQIYKWWELEDEEVICHLDAILKELDEQKYPPIYFKDIVICLVQLKNSGFEEIEYALFIDKMQRYLEYHNSDFEAEKLDILSNDRDFQNSYLTIISPLINILKKKEKIERRRINDCFNVAETWGNDFYNYCLEHQRIFAREKKFFFNIDIEKLVNCIESANVENIYGFLAGINKVYDFDNINDYFKLDIQNLNELIMRINVDKISAGKRTRKICFDKLVSKLDESLRLIQK